MKEYLSCWSFADLRLLISSRTSTTPQGHSAKCPFEISNMVLISDCYRSIVMLLLERFLFIYLILFSESLVLLVLEETFCRIFSVFWQKKNPNK